MALAPPRRYEDRMALTEQSSGPSVGPMPNRAFEAKPATPQAELDKHLERLAEHARTFARTPVAQKIAWLKDIHERTAAVATDWVRAACRAKGVSLDKPIAGEEWLAGPALTLRNIRFLIRSLQEIESHGTPQIESKNVFELAHGATGVRVTPYDAYDGALYGGISAETWLTKGIGRGDVSAHQASFYKQREPEGGVSLVLGAGNVASIPPMDILYKMFVEGRVCILKMNPVNEYLGPYLERAFQPLVDAGYLAIVYGGAEVGSHLCYHRLVDDVHITGSDKTHDLIVWGPPGPERDRRKRDNDPVLGKRITSELGNVSPVMVVPGPYGDDELAGMAENVAGMITNNASFNCNAAKLLVLPQGWPQRDEFIAKLARVLQAVPPRKAYYPGAFDRYKNLTTGHSEVKKFGETGEDVLPWTLVLGLDPQDRSEKNFFTEPFCAILSEVSIGSNDPLEFLSAAVPFANDQVWGTLNSMLFVHPKTQADPSLAAAVEAAVRDLRHGTVAINAWPALAYAFCSTPWGGHPSATLQDIQSGLGWVHDTVMLEDIEKCVVRAPLKQFPKPVWYPSHKTLHQLAKKLVAFEASPSWLKVPSIAMTALKG
jgi:aldehyde dehydrogenase (NAD(P)+)